MEMDLNLFTRILLNEFTMFQTLIIALPFHLTLCDGQLGSWHASLRYLCCSNVD